MTGKKKIKVPNPLKKKAKDEKKKLAVDGRAKVAKTLLDQRDSVAKKKAAKEVLEKNAENAAEEEAKRLRAEIDTIMGELQDDEKAIQAAEAEEKKFKQDEENADNEDEYDEMEVEDQPRNTTEYDPAALIAALLSGARLQDPSEPLDLVHKVGLRSTEAVVGYKSTGMHGKVGLVIDTEFENCQIYRIKKNVVVGPDVPDIVESRRAGVYKNRKTKTRWSVDDICLNGVRGIAIAVPPGYSGDVEDLLVPPPKLSDEEKEKLRLEKKKPPKLVDVQLLVQWNEPDSEGRFLSWENRTGCRLLWKKIGDTTIWEAAMHYESQYRKAGGRHASEDPTLFEHRPAGSTLSPGGTPAPHSTATTRENTQDTAGENNTKKNAAATTTRENTEDTAGENNTKKNAAANREEKKAARAEYKVDWCDDRGINPENMSDTQTGSFMASFKAYWAEVDK